MLRNNALYAITLFFYILYAVHATTVKTIELENVYSSLVAVDEGLDLKATIPIEFLKGNSSSFTLHKLGKILDEFLSVRPWWYVVSEPHKWQLQNHSQISNITIARFERKWDPIFRHVLAYQYPVSCNSTPFRAWFSGLDSFGNFWHSLSGNKKVNWWAVFIPYLTGSSALVDSKTCPHSRNKFECVFLRVTNCTLPQELHNGSNYEYWTSASPYGQPVKSFDEWRAKFAVNSDQSSLSDLRIIRPGLSSFFVGNKTYNATSSDSPLLTAFAYAFLYRPNHHFRSMMAHIIHKWKLEQSKPWPLDGDCVAIHIRRNERTVGDENIFEWCRKHVVYPNGTCYNDYTGQVDHNQRCIHYLDMGCNQKMPYAAVTLNMSIQAARLLSPSKNIFVRCDNATWLANQIAAFKTDEFNIFPMTPPPNHRANVHGGANYLAAIEIARECSAFVGHSGSAVTAFFYNIMCARHAGQGLKCPPFYDFSGG